MRGLLASCSKSKHAFHFLSLLQTFSEVVVTKALGIISLSCLGAAYANSEDAKKTSVVMQSIEMYWILHGS